MRNSEFSKSENLKKNFSTGPNSWFVVKNTCKAEAPCGHSVDILKNNKCMQLSYHSLIHNQNDVVSMLLKIFKNSVYL